MAKETTKVWYKSKTNLPFSFDAIDGDIRSYISDNNYDDCRYSTQSFSP